MSHQLGRIKAIFMDMDDTLVMTGDADLKAYADVVALAKRLHAQVCINCLQFGYPPVWAEGGLSAVNSASGAVHALSATGGDSRTPPVTHHSIERSGGHMVVGVSR